MNEKQSQKVNMIDSVVSFLNMPVNRAIWSRNATFSTAVDNVLLNMGTINNADGTRQASPIPFTETKGQAKTALVNATMFHAAAGKGYAASVSNTTLKTICSVTETSLVYSKGADLPSKCRNIYTAVQPFIGSMSDWNATAATLLAFDGDITTFEGLVGTPQAQISTQHAAVGAIDAQITTIDGILEDTLDTLMVQFKTTHAAFYDGYFSARKLHHTGVHHSTTITGHTRDTAAAGLPHIEVTLTHDGKRIRKHITDVSGHFRFTRLHLGTYIVEVKGAGFVTQTRTFVVTALQVIETDFVMVPPITPPHL
ncbi:MAG: carboxypeptidase-like regulatory domain-containing protein [Bacteroidia bacterium]